MSKKADDGMKPSSAQLEAARRLLEGKDERTIADKINDSSRPTWEQYKAQNSDKLFDGQQKEMDEYRKQLDQEREGRLKKRKSKKKKRKKEYSSDSSSSEEERRRRKRKKKRKKHRDEDRKHKKSKRKDDSDGDSSSH